MADSGLIELDGRDITFLPPSQRDIGVVFQNYALFPHMTVAENIAYPLKVRKLSRSETEEKTKRALDLVQLSDLGDRRISQLSGGQQQRIALARAVVYEPRMLLMDEPLGALDKKLREYMQLEIKRLQKMLKITVIYVTHDQSEALTMSDRVAIMSDGKFSQIGPPQELYKSPANKFVADFIGEACFLEGVASAGANGTATATMADSTGLHFGPRHDLSQDGKVTLMIRPETASLVPVGENLDPAGKNTMSGKVGEVVYLGESTLYHVVAADGQTLTVKQQNTRTTVPHAVGDQVTAVWEIEDTLHVQ
jgi:putative spermidine/putrescine transport system ATP-binding protein